MYFKIIHDNGDESEFSGGCYGCIGRTDSYKPYDSVREEVESINYNNDFVGTDSYDIPAWRESSRSKAKFLVLGRDFYSDSAKTFHSTRRPLMEYLFHRSPYSSCFASESVDQIMQEERILLHCKDVPSELVIALGYILRAMDTDKFFLSWKAVHEAIPDESEFLQVALAYTMQDLYKSVGYYTHIGYGDGTLLPDCVDVEALVNGDPKTSGLSISYVGGYVMNVLGMWYGRYDLEALLQRMKNKHSSMHIVKGVFGDIRGNGIVDLRSFLKDIINELKGAA